MVASAGFAFGSMSALTASAQNVGGQFIDSITSEGKNLIGNICKLVKVVIIIIAAVQLASKAGKAIKGDREVAESLAWWIAGLVVGFIAVDLLQKQSTTI